MDVSNEAVMKDIDSMFVDEFLAVGAESDHHGTVVVELMMMRTKMKVGGDIDLCLIQGYN